MSLDLKSYVPMHLGVIFGSLTLVTGSIWANIVVGHLVVLGRAPS